MENIEDSLGKVNLPQQEVYKQLVEKVFILEANMATLMNGQARILAHLENRDPEEVMLEINNRNNSYLSLVQDEYVKWLSGFVG